MSRSVLVTGAGGFVGRHLGRMLIGEGFAVAGTVLGGPRAAAMGEAVADGVEPIECDLTSKSRVRAVVRSVRPAAVVHLAAQSHVPTAWKKPELTFRVNVLGTLHLLQAVEREAPDARVLLVGSAEIYGRAAPGGQPVNESQPLAPLNPYAVSKAAADLLGGQWAASTALHIVRARPFNHTGPGQTGDYVCAAFARQAAAIALGRQAPRVVVGNLNVRRDFLDVRDVCRAYLALLRHGEPGGVYNIASGRPRSIRTILKKLLKFTGRQVQVVVDPNKFRPADQPVLCGDAGRLRAATGWRPAIPFDQTLRDMFEWWKQQIEHSDSGGGRETNQ
ncbi:MAG: GDP-mannose 4,6-dehydratase [Candidatus Sumerlaeia bacterium]